MKIMIFIFALTDFCWSCCYAISQFQSKSTATISQTLKMALRQLNTERPGLRTVDEEYEILTHLSTDKVSTATGVGRSWGHRILIGKVLSISLHASAIFSQTWSSNEVTVCLTGIILNIYYNNILITAESYITCGTTIRVQMKIHTCLKRINSKQNCIPLHNPGSSRNEGRRIPHFFQKHIDDVTSSALYIRNHKNLRLQPRRIGQESEFASLNGILNCLTLYNFIMEQHKILWLWQTIW